MSIVILSNRLRLAAMLAVSLLRISTAAAEGESGWRPEFTLRGFGTLGGVYHNDDGVKFRRDISQAGGAKADQVSFAQDSKLGVQLTAYLNEQFEATTQTMSRLTTENNFEPQLSWGYLKYKPTEEIAVRSGRLGVESYIQGDSAEIGYANLQIRQPIIFYPRSFDGMDVEILRLVAGGSVRVKGSAGWTQGELIGGGAPYDTGGSKLLGGLLEYARDGWTGRFSIGRLQLADEMDELKPGTLSLAAMSMLPNGARIIDAISMKNRVVNYRSFALAYDAGPIQSMASYSSYSSAHWPTRHMFYANMGYRLNKVTPYVSYSTQRSARNFVSTGIADGMGFDALNRTAGLAQTGGMVNQTGMAIGARYDFTDNMALKFQVDHTRYRDPESIVDADLLANSAESRRTRSLTVFSLALDFVF